MAGGGSSSGGGTSSDLTSSSSSGEVSGGTRPDSTSDASSMSTTSAVDTSTSEGSTSSNPNVPPGFLLEPDLPDHKECSQWDQNCPAGQKCVPWADDGGNSWNALRCVPVASDPASAGEPCVVEGSGVTGIDTCDAQSICFDVDENLQGECYPLCVGSILNPFCSQPDYSCQIAAEALLTICIPHCDPLLNDCEPGRTCVPSFATSADAEFFTCHADGSGPDGAVAGDTCRFPGACGVGLACVAEVPVESCDGPGCCVAYCDLTDDHCPATQECVPWFGPGLAPTGYEAVGMCLEVS